MDYKKHVDMWLHYTQVLTGKSYLDVRNENNAISGRLELDGKIALTQLLEAQADSIIELRRQVEDLQEELERK